MASTAVINSILGLSLQTQSFIYIFFTGTEKFKIPNSPNKEDLMTRLKSEVYKRRIRVKEFFFDFDRLRKGTVNEDKFRSALSMLNIYMTEVDISDLIVRYKDSEGYFKKI